MASCFSTKVPRAVALVFLVATPASAGVAQASRKGFPEDPVVTQKFGNLRTEADRMKQKINAMQVDGAVKLKGLRGELMNKLRAKDQSNRDMSESVAFLQEQIAELRRNGSKLVRQQVELLDNLTTKRETLLVIQSKLQVALDYTDLVIRRSQFAGTDEPLNWTSQLQFIETQHSPVKPRRAMIMTEFPSLPARKASLLAKGQALPEKATPAVAPKTNPGTNETLAEHKMDAHGTSSMGATQHAKSALEILQQGLQTLQMKQNEAEAKLRAGFEDRARILDGNATELQNDILDLASKKVSYTKLNEDLVANVSMLEAKALKVKRRGRGISKAISNMTDDLR